MNHQFDIGIFAHNEADAVKDVLQTLLAQDIFHAPNFDIKVHLLANGCEDNTCEAARNYLSEHPLADFITLHDLPQGGKSRTWNAFVHTLARPASNLVFMDADIRIPDPDMLQNLCKFLMASPHLSGVSSRPLKDITYDRSLASGPFDKIISAAGGGLGNWKRSICGQLYVLRNQVAHGIHIPIGLPVEDGFVRAMVQTDRFRQEGRPETALDGRDELFHVYKSERSISALIRHQTRIVVGSSINFLIFDKLRKQRPDEIPSYLETVHQQEDYVASLIEQKLPNRKYGYVPWHFLTKRLAIWTQSQNRLHPKRILITSLGLTFDLIVYLRSQYTMWRGAGAGYW